MNPIVTKRELRTLWAVIVLSRAGDKITRVAICKKTGFSHLEVANSLRRLRMAGLVAWEDGKKNSLRATNLGAEEISFNEAGGLL